VHTLGALCLDSQPLKASLKTEAAAWKEHFSSTIHRRAHADLLVRPHAGLERWWYLCVCVCVGDGGRAALLALLLRRSPSQGFGPTRRSGASQIPLPVATCAAARAHACWTCCSALPPP
jgi:hypothetical protein